MSLFKDRLMVSVAYVTTLTCPSTSDQRGAHSACHWSVRQKLNRVSSVQLHRCVRALTLTTVSVRHFERPSQFGIGSGIGLG